MILDEATAGLRGPQVERVFEIVAELKAAGAAIVFISHRMEEVYRIGDRATVLCNGRTVDTYRLADTTRAELLRAMVGEHVVDTRRPTGGQRRSVEPRYLRPFELAIKLRVWMPLVLAAAGQTFVIMGGGVDLSAGTMIAMVNVATVRTLTTLGGGAEAIVAGLAVGLAVAVLAHIRVVSYIIGALFFAVASWLIIGETITGNPLAGQGYELESIASAVIGGISLAGGFGGVPVEGASEALRTIVVGRLAGLPGILYWWAALGIGVVLVLRNTRYGRTLYALGANTAAAFLSGVRVRATRAVTYAACAACAAIAGTAGFLYLGFVGSVYNITLGDRYMLGSIVAVVVGGVALTGGVGGYAGVAVGAVLLQVLESVLTTINIQPVRTRYHLWTGAAVVALRLRARRRPTPLSSRTVLRSTPGGVSSGSHNSGIDGIELLGNLGRNFGGLHPLGKLVILRFGDVQLRPVEDFRQKGLACRLGLQKGNRIERMIEKHRR